jgi:DNA-binding response OmpR family regulator
MANETILVFDDSTEMRNLPDKYILSSFGYKVITVSNGKSGLESVTRHKPDLILLEMSMLKMTGVEMLETLKEMDCNCPVIFLAFCGSENIAVEAFRLGVLDDLNKPFTPDEVQRVVGRALRESRLLREQEELNRNMLTAEAVRVTVITLSHYLNNYLTTLKGGLTLLMESLNQKLPNPNLCEIIKICYKSALSIQAVMKVLLNTTTVRLSNYTQTTPMINIEAALRDELSRMPEFSGSDDLESQ